MFGVVAFVRNVVQYMLLLMLCSGQGKPGLILRNVEVVQS